MSNDPIFVLSHARTGSTLLRYIIDAHPDVWCPAEITLGRLCSALRHTVSFTRLDRLSTNPVAEQASTYPLVQAIVNQIMDGQCARKGKRRWCDKSTNNVDHVDVLDKTFPTAQYICLHRNCLDVVHSLVELFRFGFPGRYAQAVARSPENIVDAMIDTWLEATEKILKFETTHSERCLRVRYEDLVRDPLSVSKSIFLFLNLGFDSAMLDSVFSIPHDAGPADFKIRFTSSILRGRVGKGMAIPRSQMSSDRLAKMAAWHVVLGYDSDAIDQDRLASKSAMPEADWVGWG